MVDGTYRDTHYRLNRSRKHLTLFRGAKVSHSYHTHMHDVWYGMLYYELLSVLLGIVLFSEKPCI